MGQKAKTVKTAKNKVEPPKHGGKRAGAGRKPHPEGALTVMAITIPVALFDRLEEHRKKLGLKRSPAAVELIRAGLELRRE